MNLSQNEILLLTQLGHTLYREGQYEKAISLFEGLAELQPNSAQFHSILALLYHLTNNRESALTEGLQAMRSKPNDVLLLATLGEIYLAANQPDRAHGILDRAYAEAKQTGHPALARITLLLQQCR